MHSGGVGQAATLEAGGCKALAGTAAAAAVAEPPSRPNRSTKRFVRARIFSGLFIFSGDINALAFSLGIRKTTEGGIGGEGRPGFSDQESEKPMIYTQKRR